MTRRKQKTDTASHDSGEKHADKKAKSDNGNDNGRNGNLDRENIAAEFEKFCKEISNHLSIEQMRKILEANGRGWTGSDDAVVPRCMDMVYYGPLDQCPICGGDLECGRTKYYCTGAYSEWSTCTFNTREPPRKDEELVLPDSITESPAYDMLKEHQDLKSRNKRVAFGPPDKPFAGMTISLSGRLSQTQQRWKRDIEEHGGKVANSVLGVACLIVAPSDRERGGSSKMAEAVENGIPVVTEAWLLDSIEKQEALPLDAYDVASDLAVEGRGIPWSKQDPENEALESLAAEVKIYGKRGVYKESKLEELGGKIFQKDGILYNCVFSLSDKGRELNEFCVMQLITVPEKHLHLYYKKGSVGNDARAEEQLVEWENVDDAITDFKRLFEELTGNDFEPWEREKKFQKKLRKFFPIDMADGYDVRYGGLGLRQLGVAAAHCKLDSVVANFMKVLCGQEIYRYALMEMGMDAPDLPMGMLSDIHLQICEETLLEFVEKVKAMKVEGQKAMVVWSDFSQRWFTLLHSTRPFIFENFREMADHAASAFETVRDIVAASHLVGNMRGSTLDDPLAECYKKLGCAILPVENDSDNYKMIVNYLEKTYEPVKVGDISYTASVENVFAVEVSACPSLEEIKKLPNKVMLWCGTRSSNLMRT
ncbi:Poly [ADP-ribose] polymerase [Heracleum sosnowskyi]|uniref:Poly [ADP-ribose] polymerase n=1 Tax=Heracleum sosnowskyi TaxID=360622 RepID=A0AAD8LXX7_9APIA|nr:Poly [ADP-ribose] polymerase [Heracleum sosnowskyi]